MSGICVANEEIILPKNVTHQDLCDRRKRKSCDNDDFDCDDDFAHEICETKRSRLESDTNVLNNGERQSTTSTDEIPSSSLTPSTSNAGNSGIAESDTALPTVTSPVPAFIAADPTGGLQNGGGSSEDGSSTSGTSGIDVEEKSPEPAEQNDAGPADQCHKVPSEFKLLNDFQTFLPNIVQEKQRSALKSPKTVTPSDAAENLPKSKNVRFDVVREFRFARTQSFVTMPSYGGCSLGMEQRHMSGRELGLDRYRIERERSKRRKYRRWRKKQQVDVVTNSSSESDTDDEDDLNVEAFMGLLPVPPDRRKRLLNRSGNQIDNDCFQQNANQMVRTSRESCGCSCEGICYPETCECYINDIGCQVDRLSFPCGCIKDRCYNPNGRTSFNVERVKNHFYRTMHRLHQSRLTGHEIAAESSQQPIEPQMQPHLNPQMHPQLNPQMQPQKFSFGDFTLPQGDPPLRNEYQMSMAWNQISCMNNMNSMYNWNENCYMDRSQYDPWNHLNLPHLGINNGVSVEYPVSVSNAEHSNRQHSSNYQYQDSNTVHISCVPSNQSRMCSLQTIDQSNENERLSESSESGIGDEQVDTPNNTAADSNFQTCGGLETSMTIAYNDDSNNSVPLSVGSE